LARVFFPSHDASKIDCQMVAECQIQCKVAGASHFQISEKEMNFSQRWEDLFTAPKST
jgi:hypothetical protein